MAPAPILFCSHAVEWGGAETVLADLLGALDRTRFAPHFAGPAAGPLPDRLRALGVPVHDLRIGGSSPWRKAASVPGAARALRRLASGLGARVLYANSMIAGYAAVLAQRPGLACLWHLHTAAPSRFARLALRRAAVVVAPARAAAAAVDPRLPDSGRLCVVRNGVPERCFTAAGTGLREALGIPREGVLFGIVGRLDPHKGHEVLLQALADGPAAAHLLVIGGEAFAGALARVRGFGERLRALAAAPGLAGRVHFLGHRDDVPELVSQLDAVIVPSVAPESAPRAIAEAQAAGRAVVASRIGGVPELVEDGRTGLLVPPGDAAALAAVLQSLAADASARQRLGAAARTAAERDYRLAAMARGVAAAIERARTAAEGPRAS